MASRGVRSALVTVADVTPKADKYVCGVTWSPDGFVWVGYKNCVRKVDIQTGSVVLEVKTRSGKYCNYLACMLNGDLLISYGGSSHIDKVERNGTYREFADVKPHKCYDIVVSKKNEVGVCLKGGNLAVLTEGGQLVHRVKLGKMSGFAITNDDHYMIVDCGNGMNIVTIDQSGQHIRESFKLDESWNIERLVCDGYGNIIGLNERKEIYVIDKSGQCIQKYKVQLEVKSSLNCVAIDKDSNLIFGTSDGKVIVVSYLE